MLVADHIFLPGLAGHHPLRGPNDDALGPRFPDMSAAYSSEFRSLARTVAQAQGTAVREGVYAMVSGPSYETPAECRFLRAIGADAVGMSTVPEVLVARHQGMQVLGVSLITNVLSGDPRNHAPVQHDEVLSAANMAAERLSALVSGIAHELVRPAALWPNN